MKRLCTGGADRWANYRDAQTPETCGAVGKRTGKPCGRRDLYGGGRCRLHGGLSTGPKTPEGLARSAANGKLGGRPRKVRLETEVHGNGEVSVRPGDSGNLTKPVVSTPTNGEVMGRAKRMVVATVTDKPVPSKTEVREQFTKVNGSPLEAAARRREAWLAIARSREPLDGPVNLPAPSLTTTRIHVLPGRSGII